MNKELIYNKLLYDEYISDKYNLNYHSNLKYFEKIMLLPDDVLEKDMDAQVLSDMIDGEVKLENSMINSFASLRDEIDGLVADIYENDYDEARVLESAESLYLKYADKFQFVDKPKSVLKQGLGDMFVMGAGYGFLLSNTTKFDITNNIYSEIISTMVDENSSSIIGKFKMVLANAIFNNLQNDIKLAQEKAKGAFDTGVKVNVKRYYVTPKYDENGNIIRRGYFVNGHTRTMSYLQWSNIISRTAATQAFAQGELYVFREVGIRLVIFTTVGDEKVCPICTNLEGSVFNINDADGIIPIHPIGRCHWTPDLTSIR